MDPKGGKGFHHVAIRAKDFEASCRFYKEVLGFSQRISWKSGDKGQAAMLDAGDGNYLEVFSGGRGKSQEGSIIHFALRTNELDATMERARAAGMRVTVEAKQVEIDDVPVRVGFFIGPDGETVEMFENSVL